MKKHQRFSMISLFLNIGIVILFAFGMLDGNEMSMSYLLLGLVTVHGFSELNPILTALRVRQFFTIARLLMIAAVCLLFTIVATTNYEHAFSVKMLSFFCLLKLRTVYSRIEVDLLLWLAILQEYWHRDFSHWSLYPEDDSRACTLLESLGPFGSSEALSLPPL